MRRKWPSVHSRRRRRRRCATLFAAADALPQVPRHHGRGRHQRMRRPSTWQQLATTKMRSHSKAAQHGASLGCWHRRVAAAAGCVTCANTRADQACGSTPQHASSGTSLPTTRRRTDSWPASTALLQRALRAPATRCCTCERHVRALARAVAPDDTWMHAACACCHERGGARHAAASMLQCRCSGYHLRAHLCAQPTGWSRLEHAAFTGGAPPPAGAWLTASKRRAAPACTAVR